MPRERQLNIRLSDEELEILKSAAEERELTVTAFTRESALAAALEDPESEHSVPGWLLAVLYILRTGRPTPR